MADKYKRGRLSAKDQQFIRESVDKHSPEHIAASLGKDPAMVRKWIKTNCIVAPAGETLTPEEATQLQLQHDFKSSPEWKQLKLELSPEELRLFEHRYAKHMAQFDNIFPTEETQLFLLIKFEILMHRNLAQKQRAEEDMRRIDNDIQTLYKKCRRDISSLSQEDKTFLSNREQILVSLRSAQNASTAEYTKLQEKHSAILKELKGTRDQRLQRIENKQETFVQLIKKLQDEEYREKEGRQLALMQMAGEKELKRLGQRHKFLDNMVDRPILSAETTTDEDE